MSAYVVSSDTIDYLVAAASRYNESFYSPLPTNVHDAATLAAAPMTYDGNSYPINGITGTDLIGSILLAQNVRSVNCRYKQSEAIPEYHYTHVPFSDIDPVAVLKSIACLQYQSCETDDYEGSFAADILRRLEAAAINALPGYDAAPWGWARQTLLEKLRGAQ
jgi:hypothetical protein